MRIPNSTNRPTIGANMTPMIDVVFLLIIFFLVSSHLARQENRLPLELPTASNFDALDLEKSALSISIDRNSQVLVRGKVVPMDQLRLILSEWSIQPTSSQPPTGSSPFTASKSDVAAVRIRTDGDVPYHFVAPVLRAVADAGITDTAIAVREAQD